MRFKPSSLSASPRILIAGILVVAASTRLPAAVFSGDWNSGFANNGAIPDGNPTGWSDSRGITIPSGEIVTDIQVRVNIGGGWNGDIYAYVSHPGTPGAVILLNRPGRTGTNTLGYGDNVLMVTFTDGAVNGDIHFYQNVTGYVAAISNNSAWQPDGRTASPLAVDGTEPRTAMLSGFDGLDASSGDWTLFVADLASGDQTTVAGWGLTITTIPEPGTAPLALLAGCVMLARRRRNASAKSFRRER
jgi:uncharacterized protein (TIGR03382 family)